MSPEDLVVYDSDDVIVVVLVPVLEVLQDTQLDASLVLESFLVADNLDGDHLLLFVVEALQSLAETATANLLDYFVPVCEVVFHHNLVVTAFIVVSKVVLVKCGAFYLRC